MTSPALMPVMAMLGGLLALDRGPFLQTMISRPLPAAALAGMLLGDPSGGLLCGLYLETIWLARLPVGGSVPPDETVAALAAAAGAAALPAHWGDPARAALGVTLGMPFGLFGRYADLWVRRANGEMLKAVRKELAQGRLASLARAQRMGAARFFLVGAINGAAATGIAGLLASTLASVAPDATPWARTSVFLPIIGAASLLCNWPGSRNRLLFGLGLAGGWLSAIWPGYRGGS